MSHPKSAGLGRTGTGTSACDHTYPACYVARHTCCSNAALVGGMFSIVREPCANNSFQTPLAEHALLYTTTRNLSIASRVSELTSTGCRDRSRKPYIADGQDIHANHADLFPWPRQLDAVSHALTALKSIYAFVIGIFNNLLDRNLSTVSTDAKSNPEFIKPKRRGIPKFYCKDNHTCVHGSDYQSIAKSLSCIMRNVEQKSCICLLMGTWLEILDIPHVILCGYIRFIICAVDHLSASFACMYAIGQIAKQFIVVSITSQESLPVRQNSRSFKHPLSLRSATVRTTIDCFRLFVRYLSQTISTLLTVSS